MTITEANAANEAAEEVIKLAAAGARITPELEHGIGILLINANRALQAGYDTKSFLSGLSAARANFKRKKNQ